MGRIALAPFGAHRGLQQVEQRRQHQQRIVRALDRAAMAVGHRDVEHRPGGGPREQGPGAPRRGAPRLARLARDRNRQQRREHDGLLRQQGQEQRHRRGEAMTARQQPHREQHPGDRDQVLAARAPPHRHVGGVAQRHDRGRHRRHAQPAQPARDREQQHQDAEEQAQVDGVERDHALAREARQEPEVELAAEGAEEVADRIGRRQHLEQRAVTNLIEEQVVVGEERLGDRPALQDQRRDQDEPEDHAIGSQKRPDRGLGRGGSGTRGHGGGAEPPRGGPYMLRGMAGRTPAHWSAKGQRSHTMLDGPGAGREYFSRWPR